LSLLLSVASSGVLIQTTTQRIKVVR
jgi:hypothetical protein